MRYYLLLLTVLCLVVIALCTTASTLNRTFVNIPYGTDPEETLDVYIPPGVNPPIPALVEIHGGGWNTGGKSQFTLYNVNPSGVGMIEKIYGKNVAILSINYPLTVYPSDPQFPKNPFPTGCQSVQKAFQFIRSQASTWGINSKRIGTIGGSAGAHLGLWAAMSNDKINPAQTNPTQLDFWSSRPDWLVPCWGPTAVTKQLMQSVPARPAQWLLFGAATEAQFDLVPDTTTQAASPFYLAPTNDWTVKQAIPMLGVYNGTATLNKVSDYTWPLVDDPHSYAWWVLFQNSLLANGGAKFTNLQTIVAPSLASNPDLHNDQVANWVGTQVETPIINLSPLGVAPNPHAVQLTFSGDLGSTDAQTWYNGLGPGNPNESIYVGLWIDKDFSSPPDVVLDYALINSLIGMGIMSSQFNANTLNLSLVPLDMISLNWSKISYGMQITKIGFPPVTRLGSVTKS